MTEKEIIEHLLAVLELQIYGEFDIGEAYEFLDENDEDPTGRYDKLTASGNELIEKGLKEARGILADMEHDETSIYHKYLEGTDKIFSKLVAGD